MKTLSFLFLGLIGFSSLRAQTADEIVNKYIDAIGGKKTLGDVKSIVITSSVETQFGEGSSVTSILAGKGFKSETDFGGTKVINCFTPNGGWGVNGFMGQTSATALPEQQAKAGQGSLQVGGPLVDYAARGLKVTLAGKDATDFQLKLEGNGMSSTFYVNQQTYLIDKTATKVNAQGQEVEVVTAFKDYKKTDQGYVVPFTQQVDYPQFSITITHKSVEVNKAVDPAIFEMPK